MSASGSVALWSVLSPTIIAVSAVSMSAIERVRPYTPSQRIFRDGFWTDLLGYAFIQSYLLGLLIAKLIVWMDSATGL